MNKQFFIFGYYGWENTGDDAMIYALLHELHELYPLTIFAILSQKMITVPPETKNFVRFVRPNPRIVFQEITKSSVFIMGGGTHLYDYGGTLKRLKVMFEMLIMVVWAKIFCKKIFLLNIGIEPFTTKWGKFVSNQICLLADYISVRDKASYKILDEIGLKKKVMLSFDLAALLSPLSVTINEASSRRTDVKILGVSILPFFEIYHNDKEKDVIFVNEIAKGLNQWLKRDNKSLIYLFNFKGKSKAHDVFITEILRRQLEPSERTRLIPYNPNPLITMYKVARCHAFVGMRYHACVFAYLTKTPLLTINYSRKCQGLVEDTGLSTQTIISLEKILNGEFDKYLRNMQEYPDEFVATLPVAVAKQMARNGLPSNEVTL